jgi:hypothetical protein
MGSVLCVVNLHIATDNINKLLISQFENMIVFVWGQNLSRSTGRQDKYAASQKGAFILGIFKFRNHAGIFPDLKNFHTLVHSSQETDCPNFIHHE